MTIPRKQPGGGYRNEKEKGQIREILGKKKSAGIGDLFVWRRRQQ